MLGKGLSERKKIKEFLNLKEEEWKNIIKGSDLQKKRLKLLFYHYMFCMKKDSVYFWDIMQFKDAYHLIDYDLYIINLLKKLIEMENLNLFSQTIRPLQILYARNIKIGIHVEGYKRQINNCIYNMKNTSTVFINELSTAYEECYTSKNPKAG
jgi:hypothetical protein